MRTGNFFANYADMSATEVLRRQAREWQNLPSPSTCRAIRRNGRATLEQVAAAVSEISGEPVTGAAVGHWERNVRTPSRRNLPAYMAVLRVLQGLDAKGAVELNE